MAPEASRVGVTPAQAGAHTAEAAFDQRLG